MENNEKREDKRSKKILIVIIVLFLLFIINSFKLNNSDFNELGNQGDKITIENQKSKKDIQAELNKQVEKGMMNVSMNTNMVLKGGKANALICNSEKNHYPQFVEIFNEKGDLLYTSKIIPLGASLNEISIDKKMSIGKHKCKAYFNAYDTNTKQVVGKVGVNIEILVKK